MADKQTAPIMERMRAATIAAAKQEGREVAETLSRLLGLYISGSVHVYEGANMPQNLPQETVQRISDKVADSIEINSAIVTSVAAIVISESGHIVGATAPADAMFGYAVGELAGRSVEVWELVPRDKRDKYGDYWRKFWSSPRNIGVTFPAGAGGAPVDSVRIHAQHLDGSQFIAKIGWGHPLYVLGQRCVVAQIMHVPTWQDSLPVDTLGS